VSTAIAAAIRVRACVGLGRESSCMLSSRR
jgi:hypothetical protein